MPDAPSLGYDNLFFPCAVLSFGVVFSLGGFLVEKVIVTFSGRKTREKEGR